MYFLPWVDAGTRLTMGLGRLEEASLESKRDTLRVTVLPRFVFLNMATTSFWDLPVMSMLFTWRARNQWIQWCTRCQPLMVHFFVSKKRMLKSSWETRFKSIDYWAWRPSWKLQRQELWRERINCWLCFTSNCRVRFLNNIMQGTNWCCAR